MTVLCDTEDHREPSPSPPVIDRAGPRHPASSRRMGDQRRRSRGFTLVELLVVMAILGLIMVFAAPQVIKFLGGAQQDAAGIQIERLSGILDLYRLELGEYPSTEAGLEALIEAPAGVERWNGPYLKKAESLIDPWGNPYIYRHPGEHGEYDLYSLGKDGREGGEGEAKDITNW